MASSIDALQEELGGDLMVASTGTRSLALDYSCGNGYSRGSVVKDTHMRVLHIGPLPPPVGGIASVVYNLRELLQSHCEVDVLNNVKTTSANRALLQGISAQLRLLTRLCVILRRWRPDIVHIHTCSYFSFWRNGIDVLLTKIFGRRVILHIHGAQFHEFLAGLGGAKSRLARAIMRRADRVLVLGAVWEQRLTSWCRPESISVVPNGVFLPEVDVNSIDGGVQRIICVANYERRKGMADLIRAVAGLDPVRPVHLILVGAEMEVGHKQELQDLASALKIQNSVTLSGPVSNQQVGGLLAGSDIFCLPSYNEGLPLSLLEAMAHGLPVVATRVGSIPDAVTEGIEGCLYDAGDVPALIAALSELIQDPERARALGGRGRQRVLEKYSIEHMALQIISVYRQVQMTTVA